MLNNDNLKWGYMSINDLENLITEAKEKLGESLKNVAIPLNKMNLLDEDFHPIGFIESILKYKMDSDNVYCVEMTGSLKIKEG